MLKVISLFLISSHLLAVDLKPMNIKAGLWKSETKMGDDGMISKMLAKIPKAQRDMVKGMMESKMKSKLQISEVCFTQAMIDNPQKAYEEQMARSNGDCKFKAIESTGTTFVGSMNCKSKKFSSDFSWKALDPKKTKAIVNTILPGGGKQTILVTSNWVKGECKPK